jgi:hypothetical protein
MVKRSNDPAAENGSAEMKTTNARILLAVILICATEESQETAKPALL